MRRYFTTVIVSLTILLAFWLYGLHTFRQAIASNRAMMETVATLATVNSMIVALNQLETEFEAFAVTGSELSRERWQQGRTDFIRLADALETQLATDSAQAQQLRASRSAFEEWVEHQHASGVLGASAEERRAYVEAAIYEGDWFDSGREVVGRAIDPLVALQARAAERMDTGGVRTQIISTRAERAVRGLGVGTFLLALSAALLLGRRGRLVQQHNRELREQMNARERADRELQRLNLRQRLILDSAADGIIGAQHDGTIGFINRSAQRMLGTETLEVGDPIGRMDQIIEPGPGLEGNLIVGVLEDGRARENVRGVLQCSDGRSFPVELSAVPARDDHQRITGLVITFRDISERLEIERMKNEFISVVSHELRTPLTSLRGSLGLLATGRLGELEPVGGRMLEIAVESTDRLIRLVSDILDIERMEAGRVTLEIEPVEFRELARSAVDQMRPMAEEHGVELILAGEPIDGLADPDRILQVMTNLLSNAIKFSNPGERVELTTTCDEGQRPLIQVSDTGRGIPPEKLDAIFDRFQQVDSTDARTHGGTGLGLAVCRSIVEQHGGRIWVESESGVGSTFSFVLPGPDANPTGGEEEPDPFSEEAPLVLLWSEEEVDGAVGALHRAGYRTAQVGRHQQVVEEAARLQPEALLLDVNEPGADELEMLETFRSDARTREIPVIVLGDLAPHANLLDTDAIVEWVEPPSRSEEVVDAVISARISRKGAEHILIVEDDPDLAAMLAEGFAQRGIRTEHAATGREALVMALRSPPAMVVLDLMLPEGNGEWVIAWMRRHRSLRDTTLMVYSARDLGTDERERLRLGETEFLTKTEIPPQEFEERVLQMFQRVAPVTAAEDGEGVP